MTQEIQITNLNNNPGILPYELGIARVRSKTHTFLHYYDLLPIKHEFDNFLLAYVNVTKAIKSSLSHPYFLELENFDKAILYQLNLAEIKLNSLLPMHRSKRGLINGLGTVIKAISGNLDVNDAIHYDHAISELRNNQQEVVEKLNKQISVTTTIIQNFNKTISLIKSNQETLSSGIDKIRRSVNKFVFEFNDYLQTRNVLDQLNLGLNIILQMLGEIENSIAFARLGTLHTSIVKPNEMKSIIDTVLKFHSINEILFNNIDNDTHRYYDVLTVDAYYSGDTIVFAVHFPIVYPENYLYYHLYPIPTQNSTAIIPVNTYLIMNENRYQYISQPCVSLKPQYYCSEENLSNGLETEDCIFQLLRLQSNPNNCRRTPVKITRNIIQRIDDFHYVVLFINRTKIETRCGKTDFTILEGNYLIKIPYQCQFVVDNEKFINEKYVSEGQPLLLPEVKIPYQQKEEEIPEITIENIPLDEIHSIQATQNQLKPILLKHLSNKNTKNVWDILVYVLIGIIIISVILHKIINKLKKEVDVTTTQEEIQSIAHPLAEARTFFSPENRPAS